MELHMGKPRDLIRFVLILYGFIIFHHISTRVLLAVSLSTVTFKTQTFFNGSPKTDL